MDFSEYQRQALRTARSDRPLGPGHLCNWAMGLAGESAEVMEHIKKVTFHGHDLDAGKVEKELGDCLWYLAVLAAEVGLALEDIATSNIAKLRKRYPKGFSAEKSINRKENQDV